MRTPLRRYYHGRHLVAMRDVQAGTTRYYHFNHQGTVQCLTNEQGQVTDRFAADAWGRQVKRTGTSINRQWYIGNLGYYREVDRALDYVRARYLAVAVGRWLSRDPLGPAGPDVHAFAYVRNGPGRYLDPAGLQACSTTCCCCPASFSGLAVFPEGYLDIAFQHARDVEEQAYKDAVTLLDEVRRTLGVGDVAVGHRVHLDANLLYLPAQTNAACKIEWWECSDDPPLRIIEKGERWPAPNSWTNLTSDFLKGPHSTRWREEERRRKNCPSEATVQFFDTPTVGNVRQTGPGKIDLIPFRRRYLYIMIRVRKAPDCNPCDRPEIVFRMRQLLQVEAGKLTVSDFQEVQSFPGGDPGAGKACEAPESTIWDGLKRKVIPDRPR